MVVRTVILSPDADRFGRIKRMLQLRGNVAWISTPEDVAELVEKGDKLALIIDHIVHRYTDPELSHEANTEHPFRKALREANIVRRKSGLVTRTTWVDVEDRSWRARLEDGRNER